MTTVQKWGNSLAVRIPAAIATQADIGEGCPVEFEEIEGTIVIKPSRSKSYSLAEMLKQCTPSRLHGEFEYGPDVGNEVLD